MGKSAHGGTVWEHLHRAIILCCLSEVLGNRVLEPALLVFLGKGVLGQGWCWDDLTSETTCERELALPRGIRRT